MALRDMLTHFTLDKIAIQVTKMKKGKACVGKSQVNKDVERLIARLQHDEQKALKVFIDAGVVDDVAVLMARRHRPPRRRR